MLWTLYPALLVALLVITTAVTANRGISGSRGINPSTNPSSSISSCSFPQHWAGSWFQSGVRSPFRINSTHVEQKGHCVEMDESGKYLLYDREDSCYRCLVLGEMHPTVLQYKESYCMPKDSLKEICGNIGGDGALYSMFRVWPEPAPEPCPFRGAPFAFSYNKGSGDCSNPPSRADSCTDDSRLLLKYQACPDVAATESNVEELVCLASFKEGSIKYLVGKITQVNRRIDTSSHEESYRCFVYKKNHHDGKVTYDIAQSADATCNGLNSQLNIIEGSKTMRLTSVDNQHNRCRFPSWITDHHKWYSLDHKRMYHFSHKNATLKISDEFSKPTSTSMSYGGSSQSGLISDEQRRARTVEMRLVCHSILQSIDNKKIQIVAHITEGCNSGHICMTFNRRDSGVIELQQSEIYEDNSDDACHDFDQNRVAFITLITSALQPRACPHPGRYHVNSNVLQDSDRRKKRQKTGTEESDKAAAPVECTSKDYESLDLGCSSSNEMLVFHSVCSSTAYTCHGSWHENGVNYLIAAPISRKSNDVRRFCFAYTQTGLIENDSSTDSHHQSQQQQWSRSRLGGSHARPTIQLSVLTETCHRDIAPGQTARAFNLTSNGTCAESSSFLNSSVSLRCLPCLLVFAFFLKMSLTGLLYR